jgi:ElaA protein
MITRYPLRMNVICPPLRPLQWATLADLAPRELLSIMRARQEVFILEQQCNYLDADQYDEIAWHGIMWDCADSTRPSLSLAGYLRVLPPNTKHNRFASFGRVLTTAPWRGTGLGKRVINEALLFIRDQFDNPPIKISAQSYLRRFYEAFGFEVTSESYLDVGIEHFDMIRPPDQRPID